jgi:putative membrane protein
MRAAIVNNDKPVTINGRPCLGRQPHRGSGGGSDVPSNLDWVISNTDDAAAGLADGSYDAVITIPENFRRRDLDPHREDAREGYDPGPDRSGRPRRRRRDHRDDHADRGIRVRAAAVSQQYLTNVPGLHEPARPARTRPPTVPTSSPAARSRRPPAPLSCPAARPLASGAGQLGTGASDLSSGLDKLATGATGSAAGAGQLVDGLNQLSAQFTATTPNTLGGTVSTTAQYASAAATATQELAAKYQKQLVENARNPASPVQTPTAPRC